MDVSKYGEIMSDSVRIKFTPVPLINFSYSGLLTKSFCVLYFCVFLLSSKSFFNSSRIPFFSPGTCAYLFPTKKNIFLLKLDKDCMVFSLIISYFLDFNLLPCGYLIKV